MDCRLEVCVDLQALVIPKILRNDLKITRLVARSHEHKMVWAIHRQPVGEMTESLEHDTAVVAKIMLFAAAVNQDALARCKYLLVLFG